MTASLQLLIGRRTVCSAILHQSLRFTRSWKLALEGTKLLYILTFLQICPSLWRGGSVPDFHLAELAAVPGKMLNKTEMNITNILSLQGESWRCHNDLSIRGVVESQGRNSSVTYLRI